MSTYMRPLIKASGPFHTGKWMCESPCPSGIGWVSDSGPTPQSAYLRWRIVYVARRQGIRGSLPPPPLRLMQDDINELFENHQPVDAIPLMDTLLAEDAAWKAQRGSQYRRNDPVRPLFQPTLTIEESTDVQVVGTEAFHTYGANCKHRLCGGTRCRHAQHKIRKGDK